MKILIKTRNYNYLSQKKIKNILIVDVDYKTTLKIKPKFSSIIYCSSQENNLFMLRKINSAQKAVYIKNKNLVIFDGQDNLPIIRLKENINKNFLKGIIYWTALAYSYQFSFLEIRFFLKEVLD